MLAEHLRTGADTDLATYLAERVFAGAALDVEAPVAEDVEGYGAWLAQYEAGLAIERAATQAIR